MHARPHSMFISHDNGRRDHRPRTQIRAAFSLTELLVVIGIIVLLIGILLVALGAVQRKAQRTKTLAVMQAFSDACSSFYSDTGGYPGVIPDDVINNNLDGNGNPLLSSTENAILHLLGGFRVLSPTDPLGVSGIVETDYNLFLTAANGAGTGTELVFGSSGWRLAIDSRKVGDGPVINGKPHSPYFTVRGDELRLVPGQLSDPSGNSPDSLKDLVDSWGQPIIYFRRVRDRGPLRVDTANPTVPPQFILGGVNDYLYSNLLGELGRDQVWANGNQFGSVLTAPMFENRNFARMVRHPGVSAAVTAANPNSVLHGTAQGAFGLISAGPDGIYFSGADGPGSAGQPIAGGDISQMDSKVIAEFDDVLLFGGG